MRMFHHVPAILLSRLSQEGLFYLLDSVEERLGVEQTRVYGGSSLDERRLVRMIRYPVHVCPST